MRPLLPFLLTSIAWAADLPKVIFLEPVAVVETKAAEIHEKMPLYQRVADDSKYRPWLSYESAQRALRLYAQASRIAAPVPSVPDYS